MKRNGLTQFTLGITALLGVLWLPNCGDEYHPKPSGEGGSATTEPEQGGGGENDGGTSSVGGTTSSGGATIDTSTGGSATGGAGGLQQSSVGSGGVDRAGASGASELGGVAGSPCAATPTPIVSEVTTFAANTSGFALNAINGTATFTQTTHAPPAAPSDLCVNGCAVMSLSFVNGDLAWDRGMIVEKTFASATSLVGAKIITRVAFDNPSNTPVQFKLFALSGEPDWLMAERAITTLIDYPLAGGAKDFEYVVVDRMVGKKQFCAAHVVKYGVQIQTAAAITPESAGTVTAYLQFIAVLGPGGSLGAGVTAGAAGSGNVSTGGGAGQAGASSSMGGVDQGSAGITARAGTDPAGTAGAS